MHAYIEIQYNHHYHHHHVSITLHVGNLIIIRRLFLDAVRLFQDGFFCVFFCVFRTC